MEPREIENKKGSPHGVMTKLLDFGFKVSLNSNHTIEFTFRLIPLGKV